MPIYLSFLWVRIRLLLLLGFALAAGGSLYAQTEEVQKVLQTCNCPNYIKNITKKSPNPSPNLISLTQIESNFNLDFLPNTLHKQFFLPLRDAQRGGEESWKVLLARIKSEIQPLLKNEADLRKKWEANMNKLPSNKSSIQTRSYYTLCVVLEALQGYYQKHPATKTSSGKDSDTTHTNSTTTANTLFTPPISMLLTILIAVGASLISMIIAILVARAGRQPAASPEELGKMVLKSSEVAAALNKIRNDLSNNIDIALEAKARILAATFADEVKGMIDKEMNTQVGALQQQVQRIPVVDTAAIERILNDLNTRTAQLERSPKTKYEIHYSPNELTEFIQQNKQLQEILRETLQINKLQATLIEKIPAALQLSDLDALQKIAADFYWKSFSLNPNYLPAFKNQLIRDVEREVTRVLQTRR